MNDYSNEKKEQKTKEQRRLVVLLMSSWICLIIGISVGYLIENSDDYIITELKRIFTEPYFTTVIAVIASFLGLYSYKIQRIQKRQTYEWEETYSKYLSDLLREEEKWAEVNDEYIAETSVKTNKEKDIEVDIIKKTDNRDIIALMIKNYGEITEYFKISKRQAKSSYCFAMISCIAGICILVVSIYGVLVIANKELAIVGIISGAIVEVISGTVLWVHNKSALQLNHYYDALHENEKFLSAINLADKLCDRKREEMYVEIIRKQINSQGL